jgi:hypothetical protein
MQFRSQLAGLGNKLRQSNRWLNTGIQTVRLAAFVALVSCHGWAAVSNAIPFVQPILTLNTGVQAVVYAASCIGGMAGFIAAWKHEHSWSGIGSKALEYGSVGAMCIGFPLFLTAIIPGANAAVI